MQSSKDENDIVAGRTGTTFTYDKLNRPLITTYNDGGQTSNNYNDTSLPASVSSLTKIDASKNISQTTILDGFGRTQQTQMVVPTQDCSSGVVKTDFTFDLFGRQASESNPYCTTSDSTYGITKFTYDPLGRTKFIVPTDGTLAPDGSSCTNCTQNIYVDNAVTVIDPAGKQRTTYTDAYGRITRVDEPVVQP